MSFVVSAFHLVKSTHFEVPGSGQKRIFRGTKSSNVAKNRIFAYICTR